MVLEFNDEDIADWKQKCRQQSRSEIAPRLFVALGVSAVAGLAPISKQLHRGVGKHLK